MFVGIIAVAAGVKKAIGHAYGHVSLAQALALGGGVAVFLAGDLLFRRILAIGRPGYRLVALVGALASVPLGLVVAAGRNRHAPRGARRAAVDRGLPTGEGDRRPCGHLAAVIWRR